MEKVHTRVVWLPVLVIFALGIVFLQTGYRPASSGTVAGQVDSTEGIVYAAPPSQQEVSSAGVQSSVDEDSAPLLAQTSPTVIPFQAEVLPPVVSAPVPRGTGLFDEIADRLLRSLLNIF